MRASAPGPGRPPLDGVKVLDFSRLFAGPYCTLTLADLGADVIKVESPDGDDARRFGPPFLGGEGMNFMALNRGKRSFAVDLKRPEGRDAVQRLAATADVVVENFRPGVTAKLGIDDTALRAANPGLVYCSITGFGETGAYRDRPALDLILQAMTGVMDRQGRTTGRPEVLVVTLADTYAAAVAVQSSLAALLARVRDGVGQRVEVTLLEALTAAQGYRIISPAEKTMLPGFDDTVPYGAFEAQDGQWLVLAVVSPGNWRDLCEAIERPDLAADPRFVSNPSRVEHREALLSELAATFGKRDRVEWLEVLGARGVPVGPVRTVEDLVDDSDLIDRGTIVRVEHPTAGALRTMGSPLHLARTPVTVGPPAPLLGQHTSEILGEAGFDDDAIAHLVAAGAVIQGSAGGLR
jgi:crotonobetainyl-CoA:carnitine CoA-transferase CaiB-like acyl-CoA transferase